LISLKIKLRIGLPVNNTFFWILLILLYLFTITPIQAKINQPLIDSFYFELYNYRFLSADSSLHQIEQAEADNGIVNLLQITYQWWLIISGESDPSGIDPLLGKIDRSINEILKKNSADELSRDELFQIIAMYSFKSRVQNLLHNRLSSYAAFNTSMDYFDQLSPCDKTSCDMYNFVAGMYYSLGGFMKKEHPSLFFLTFDNRYADQEKGYLLLQQGTQSANQQIRTESIYFLMKLYLEVQDDPKAASKYSELLVNLFPDNLVFRFNHILTLRGQGEFALAESEIANLVMRSQMNEQLSEKQKSHFREEISKLNP
jgi:hypothetical protein